MNLQEFINTKTTKYTSVTIEYKGYIFKASINYSEHNIWNKDGNIAVYNWKGELPISQEKLEQLLQWTIDGVYFCNRCLEKIEGNPIQFFIKHNEKVRKETAKEILKELKFLYAERQKEYTNWDGNKINAVTTEWLNSDIESIAEEYGVKQEGEQ